MRNVGFNVFGSVMLSCSLCVLAGAQETGVPEAVRQAVTQYCTDCHDSLMYEADLDLERLLDAPLAEHSETWEKVLRKVRARQMPPPGKRRPDEAGYSAMINAVMQPLDAAYAANPNPGRTDSLRRMNRTEYRNAVRDLLALDVDVTDLLPRDEEGHGFDNVTVSDLSPTLLDRYISAAQKISRLAVGSGVEKPESTIVRIPPDLTQEEHIAGLPLGTRGGALIEHTFPRDGEYEISLRLARDRNEHVEGLNGRHEVDLMIDGERIELFSVERPQERNDHSLVDVHLTARIEVAAGPHAVGATFIKKPSSVLETGRQPFNAHFNFHRHPRLTPALYQVSIMGPFDPGAVAATPSRERIFVCRPESPDDEVACAERILGTLLRRAYRRQVGAADLVGPMAFYEAGYAEGGFEAGIERALAAVLVSPEFLFRVERDPADAPPGEAYPVSDLELASRLSYFLWSSIPDDALLEDAIDGRLREPGVLEGHTRRMLADPRAENLVSNFAGQWLYLRNLASITPDLRRFPDFDDNLRAAFRTETELFFESILREDRSVLELIGADYTYLNERLAKHYGVPHVYGSRFRRVELGKDSHRGGLLRHGSILTVTSYATRTSPVIRGNWVLENIMGTPAPPPPPDVPSLDDNTVEASLPMRERLAEHRANPACASCHNLMDPVGFALENYDAVGRWRGFEEGRPIDASGGLPDGSEFDTVGGLEKALLARPELFVGTLSEKLLTFALGRGIEAHDAPAIRGVVREAEDSEYSFSSLILGIVKSAPFQMRMPS